MGQQCAQALERARLFAAEQSARADAEAANRAKTEFLAMMSHELRTPLNAIAGYTELLELGISGPVSDMQREQLGRIRRSQRHLLGIIEDLLDLSRLEHGVPADIELGPVPVHETLGSLEALIAPQLKARNLTYIYNPGEGDLVAYGNRARVEQIVLNLLSNAIKYTAPGGRVGLSSELHGGSRGDSGERHRARDPAREAGFDLRAVHAAGNGPDANDRRHRARPRHQPAPGARHDGRPDGAERDWGAGRSSRSRLPSRRRRCDGTTSAPAADAAGVDGRGA